MSDPRQLTIDAVDPIAKIPEFKVAAVRLEPLAKAAAAECPVSEVQ